MRHRLLIFLLVMVISLPGLAACGGAAERREGKISVVTTTLPMYLFAANVAGDAAEVQNLVPPGVGGHSYQFTPEDVAKVSRADVIVKNGLGMELWLDNLLESAGRKELLVIDTSAGVETMPGEPEEPSGVEEPEGGPIDPHIWLDPVLAIRQVENIRDGLIQKDPRNQAVYQGNAGRFISRLQQLDKDIREQVSGFRSRDYVAFHAAFSYFGRRYGLNQVAVLQETPGKEPSPRYLAQVVTLVKAKGIKALFIEPQFSPRLAQALAADLGLELLTLDPLETGELRPDYYEEVMRRNTANLARALRM